MSEKKSFWTTLPGILTGITGVITATGGLLVILHQVGVIGLKTNEIPNESEQGKTKVERRINEIEPEIETKLKLEEEKGEPVLLSTSACSRPKGRIKYWDFDRPNCSPIDNKTIESDFWFKANDPRDPDTMFGVVPHNGAKIAPRHPDSFPWEIKAHDFTSAQGVYSVPQHKRIPCITSNGLLCQFMIWLEGDNKRLTFFRYEIR